jgi:hypothetical protein
LAHIGGIGLGKPFKDIGAEFLGNAGTLIRYADPEIIAVASQLYFDGFAFGREFGGVGKKVGQHLVEAFHIAIDEGFGRNLG